MPVLPAEASVFWFCWNTENLMVTTHVFIATSLDGYIARHNDDIDWLLQRDDPNEDHGYTAFIADKDWIVMGRGSYEKVRTFETWPYDRPVLVLSRQLADTPVPDALRGKVQFSGRNRSCPARFGKIAVWRPSRGYRFDAGLQPQLPFGSGAVALSGDAITPRPTPLRYAQKKTAKKWR